MDYKFEKDTSNATLNPLYIQSNNKIEEKEKKIESKYHQYWWKVSLLFRALFFLILPICLIWLIDIKVQATALRSIINENNRILKIMCNKLTGTLPDNLHKLKNLKVFNVKQNNIEGPVNVCLSLTNLVSLDLSENNFSGALVLDNLCKMKKLGTLNLSYNTIAGSLFTAEVCNALAPSLEAICVSGNNFNGELIPDIGNMTKLRSLYLDDNMFMGIIPREICKLTNLQRLWLAKNEFAGDIPKKIGRLRQLRTLDIGNNKFGPLLPESIGKLKRLTVLRVNDNELVGFFNIAQVQKLTLLEEISFKNNEYLDDMCLENIREWARNRGVSLQRRDNFHSLEIKPADPVTESSSSESEDDDGTYVRKKRKKDDDDDDNDEEGEEASDDDSNSSDDDGSTSSSSDDDGDDEESDDDGEESSSSNEEEEESTSRDEEEEESSTSS